MSLSHLTRDQLIEMHTELSHVIMDNLQSKLTPLLNTIASEVANREINYSVAPLNQKERDLIAVGDRVRAIKEYRNRTGCGLRHAKTVTDIYLDGMAHRSSI